MNATPFQITLDPSAPRLDDVPTTREELLRRYRSGESQQITLHAEDYQAMGPQVRSRVSLLIR